MTTIRRPLLPGSNAAPNQARTNSERFDAAELQWVDRDEDSDGYVEWYGGACSASWSPDDDGPGTPTGLHDRNGEPICDCTHAQQCAHHLRRFI